MSIYIAIYNFKISGAFIGQIVKIKGKEGKRILLASSLRLSYQLSRSLYIRKLNVVKKT